MLDTIARGLIDTITAGTYNDKPITCALVRGRQIEGEVPPNSVLITPPALGFDDTIEEGWQPTASEWPLWLTTARSGEPDVSADGRFTLAVLAALAADPTLDGTVEYAVPLAMDTPLALAPPAPAPPKMYRRTLRVRTTHHPE